MVGISHLSSQEKFQQETAEGLEGMIPGFLDDVQAPHDGAAGDYFNYYNKFLKIRDQMGDNMIIFTYEELTANFRVEVERLAVFLGVALTEAKFTALEERTSLDSMRKVHLSVRKGGVGGYVDHCDQESWAAVDEVANARLFGAEHELSSLRQY